jgi:tetratricopeptide (TPR) repeat protein
LLETIREYALEQLRASGKEAALRERHAAYFLALAEEAARRAVGRHQLSWTRQVDEEQQNLRSAIDWAIRHEPPTALRLATALWPFWLRRGLLSQGRERLRQVLDANPAAGPAQQAELLRGIGLLARDQGDYQAAREAYNDSIALERATHHDDGVAESLTGLAAVSLAVGDLAGARRLAEEGLRIRRALGEPVGIARALNYAAWTARHAQDLATARQLNEEALTLYRELDHISGVATSLNSLGEVARAEGQLEVAGDYYERALLALRESGDANDVPDVLHNLGRVALYRGDLTQAEHLFQESLRGARLQGNKLGAAHCLAGLAAVAVDREGAERAVRLLGAAEVLLREIGGQLDPIDRAPTERTLAACRVRTPPELFARAWFAGGSIPIDEVLVLGAIQESVDSDPPRT